MAKTHEEYWQGRADDILRWVDRRDIDVFKRLQDIYGRNALDIQKEIFSFYEKYAEDNQITLQEAKKKLRGVDLSDYQANARKYFEEAEENPELLERLNEQYRSSQVTRLEALQLDLTYQTGLLNGLLQVTFAEYLKRVASHSYRKITGGRAASTLSPHVLEEIINTPWNGYNYSQGLWGNTDNLARDLRETFERGFVRGSSVQQMGQEIRKKYDVARHRAETLVRTDGTMVINNATAKRYMDAGLETYRIHVHLDERTTEICKDINKENKLYSFSDYEPGITAPPFHYNCRSTLVPDEAELNEPV